MAHCSYTLQHVRQELQARFGPVDVYKVYMQTPCFETTIPVGEVAIGNDDPNPIISLFMPLGVDGVEAIATQAREFAAQKRNRPMCGVCGRREAQYVHCGHTHHHLVTFPYHTLEDVEVFCETCALGADNLLSIDNMIYYVQDDIDREPIAAGEWPFDANGKAYGMSIYSWWGTQELVDRFYAPTEQQAEELAREHIIRNTLIAMVELD